MPTGPGDWYCLLREGCEEGMAAATAGPMSGARAALPGNTKGKHANLDAALDQLRRYRTRARQSAPVSSSSDMANFRIHTAFTYHVSERHEFGLQDLKGPCLPGTG